MAGHGYLIWEVNLDSARPGKPIAKAETKEDAQAHIDKMRPARKKKDPIVHGIRKYTIE